MLFANFKGLVKHKSKHPKSFFITNSSINTAATALIQIFDSAEKEIQLLVGSYDSEIPKAKGYKEALISAIKRNVKVQILFCKEPSTSAEICKFLNAMKADINWRDYIHMYKVNSVSEKVLYQEIDNDGKPFYFAVADKVMYRFEEDIENHYALINYADSVRGERLSEVFTTVFNLSDPVQEQEVLAC